MVKKTRNMSAPNMMRRRAHPFPCSKVVKSEAKRVSPNLAHENLRVSPNRVSYKRTLLMKHLFPGSKVVKSGSDGYKSTLKSIKNFGSEARPDKLSFLSGIGCLKQDWLMASAQTPCGLPIHPISTPWSKGRGWSKCFDLQRPKNGIFSENGDKSREMKLDFTKLDLGNRTIWAKRARFDCWR